MSPYHGETNLIEADKEAAAGKGWYFLLDPVTSHPAERILGKALVVSGVVFVTSFAPSDDLCGGGGESRLYAFDYINAVVDPEDQKILDTIDHKRFITIGSGVPSEPVYYFNPTTKKPSILIQKSTSEITKADPKLKERPMLIKSWKAR